MSTRGLLDLSSEFDTDTCDLVKQMYASGAIQLLKGNTAQAGVPFNDAHNNVWLQSSNPWNPLRIVGSSSEASLVARRCVNFAVTEDLFGEQRINSMFNGVFALTVSSQRLSSEMLDS